MTFAVIGGDRRQAELAQLLASGGAAVVTYGLGAGGGVSLLICFTIRKTTKAKIKKSTTVLIKLP